MGKALDVFLGHYSCEAREMTLCLRQLILEVFPNAYEIIDFKSGLIAYGYSSACDQSVFAIAISIKHLNLLFSKSTQLNDPEKLLSGTGKQVSHIKIRSESPNSKSCTTQASMCYSHT